MFNVRKREALGLPHRLALGGRRNWARSASMPTSLSGPDLLPLTEPASMPDTPLPVAGRRPDERALAADFVLPTAPMARRRARARRGWTAAQAVTIL
jgi:hypothetical protein